MLKKGKALYQAKLILESLSKEEYNLVPRESIEYIEKNYEFDENITISPNIPLEEQNIDEVTYEILEPIIKKAQNNMLEKNQYDNNDIYNDETDQNKEIIRLKAIIESLEKENSKISQIKDLVRDYRKLIHDQENEIKELKEKNESLKTYINKIPKILRRIFIKENKTKLLKESN